MGEAVPLMLMVPAEAVSGVAVPEPVPVPEPVVGVVPVPANSQVETVQVSTVDVLQPEAVAAETTSLLKLATALPVERVAPIIEVSVDDKTTEPTFFGVAVLPPPGVVPRLLVLVSAAGPHAAKRQVRAPMSEKRNEFNDLGM